VTPESKTKSRRLTGMKIPKVFRQKKRRKYPVKWDEYGKSARSRCFEMFADKTPLNEIEGGIL
jgi:hypothetical protein